MTKELTIDDIAEAHFTFSGVNINQDGHTSYKVYECKKCKRDIPHLQVKEHYEMHVGYDSQRNEGST